MALTSYLFKSTELNDGVTYSIPLADQSLDDPNSADASWAYRKQNTPVQTNLSIKEGVFTLNINIIAVYGETAAQFEAKLNKLKQIFDTRDPAFYQLQRKFPHEQYYRFLNVAPREVAINRVERKVSVTLQTADKTWQDATLHTITQTLFETAARTENITITYNGLFPVEPVVKVQAVTPGSDGPTPLYYREVTLYSVGAGAAGRVTNNPVLLVNNWNTNAEVAASKMRSDGLDISVTLPDGTVLRRYIGGTQAARKVWINPQTWPYQPSGTLVDGPGAGAPNDPPQSHRSLLAGQGVCYFNMLGTETFPQTGKFMLDNEVIAYNGYAITSTWNGGQQVQFQNLSRGQDGTAAADHVRYTPLKRPVTLRVNYGYAAGYAQVFYNDLNGWPLLDYELSNNFEWVQTDTFDPNPNNRPYTWRADVDPLPLRAWESVIASPETQQRQALYGTYVGGAANSTVHHRLLLPTPGYETRMVDFIRLVLTLKGGQAGYPSITVKLCKLKSGYGSPYGENVQELWSYTHNSASEATVDTGYIFTDQRWTQGSHYFLRLVNAAPGGQVRNVRVDEFRALLDYDYWVYYPIASALGTERGPGTGEYPTNISWQNLSDPQRKVFSIYTVQATGQQVTVDCAEHSVSGMNLSECSYAQANWLRLLPGVNTIQVSGPQGAGQMQVTIEWRERT